MRAFEQRENQLQLETEDVEAMTEWKNWRWFVDPRHNRVIEQLNRRLRDKNLKVRKRIVNASQNQLARYLAEDAVATKFSPVRIFRPFGRVGEIYLAFGHGVGICRRRVFCC